MGTLRLPATAFALLALAGCGSTADQGSLTGKSAVGIAPKTAGAMIVAPVDGRVGDATTASSGAGLTELKVTRRPTDPRILRDGVGAGAACPDVDLMPAVENLPAIAAATVCLVNGERADAGVPPLAANAKLDVASLGHSQDMVTKSYFAHASQDGSDVADRVRGTGYIPSNGEWTVGENLAWGTGTLATPGAIVQAWMNSQGHRENILRAGFKEAGLGIALGNPRTSDGQGATYTMNFGATGANRTVSLSSSQRATTAPATSDATRRAAERRAATARKRRACRAKAKKARAGSVRKARIARCARAARRSRR
jgi:uncharacterized protein YkwD